MPSPIISLADKIYSSPSFEGRFRKLQNLVASARLSFEDESLDPSDVERLLLQTSVLALSDDLAHKRAAQKVNALLHEADPHDALLNYAIQIISSRLGNFPAISDSANLFGDSNLFKKIKEQSLSENAYLFDAELIGNLSYEEERSRLKIKEHVYHFNTFQKEVFTALQEKSLVSFSAPTSFGKSFIVRHYIAKQFAEDKMGRVLIIVPSKSLIDGFFEDLSKIKRNLDLDFGIFTHTRTLQEEQPRSVFILTQERLSFLINKNPQFISTFQFVYCDEAHCISRGYRGFVLRDVLRKVVSLCGIAGIDDRDCKYVFSSPIIKNPNYYKEKIFPGIPMELSFHKEIQYSPVEKNIHFVSKGQNHFKYSLLVEQKNSESFNDRLAEIGTRSFSERPAQHAISNADKKIQQDVQVVLQSGIEGRSILYATGPLSAHRYAIEIASHLQENSLIDRQELEDLEKYIKDHYDDSFGLIELLKKGVGLHYGPMPVGLRRAIVSLFEKGKIVYLICTSTLLEGVNLPAKNIYIFSNKYGGPGGKQKHTSLSFWNLVGRAGRLTYGLSGNVFCIEQRIEQYKELIENTDSEIHDPEADVLANETRKRYALQTFFDRENRFSYIRAQGRDDIEYLVFELLTTAHPERLIGNFQLDNAGRIELLQQINEQKNELSIPQDLLRKNPGIDPRLQEMLYRHLNAQSVEDIASYFSLTSSALSMTGEQLSKIVTLTSNNLCWPKNNEILKISNRITQWTHEFTISSFIQQTIRHLGTGNTLENHLERVDAAIRVIRSLESDLAYSAPKYLKCFFDIALNIASIKGIEATAVIEEKVEAFLFALESGVSSLIGKFLFERGVSRPIAIKTSALVDDLQSIPMSKDFFDRPDVKERLRSSLSKLAMQELEEHLRG